MRILPNIDRIYSDQNLGAPSMDAGQLSHVIWCMEQLYNEKRVEDHFGV